MSMTHNLNLSQCYLEFKLCTLPPPSGGHLQQLLAFIGQEWSRDHVRFNQLGNEFDSQISSFLLISYELLFNRVVLH